MRALPEVFRSTWSWLRAGGAPSVARSEEAPVDFATSAPAQMLSLLSPEDVQTLGILPPDAIVGSLCGEPTVRIFVPNPAFLPFLHETIAKAGPLDPGLQAAASKQGEGYLYVIDLRTPDGPHGRVPLEDIVGCFKVADGRFVLDGYQAFKEYAAYSRDGIIQLPRNLDAALRQALRERVGCS